MRNFFKFTLLIFLISFLVDFTFLTGRSSAQVLLQQADFVYQGAFRLPGGTFGASMFDYDSGATASNAANNSLFMIGYSGVAEIPISNIVNSTNLNSLAIATVLQNFVGDPSEGIINTIGDTTNGVVIGGLLVDQGKLYGTAYLYYE